MNILFVTYNTCARAAKEAKALESAGHQVIVLQHVAVSEEILYATELSSFYNADQDLLERIAYFGDWAEVIHVHNEPNWMVKAAATVRNMVCPLVPIVFDVHDLDSMREDGSVDPTEEPAIKAADAFIFPSKAYDDGITGLYFLRGNPRRVIYSMCSRSDIVTDPLPRVNGLVYEGAIVAPVKNFNPQTPGYKKYRDYTGLAEKLTASGIPFHLYGVRNEFKPSYLKAGAVAHSMHRFPDMMRQLSRYHWGLCGHLDSHPQWQKAMPNKLFEYIAAGIPVISINAGEVSEFVKKHGIGCAVDGTDYLRNAKDIVLRNAYADVIMENRHKFTMESQIGRASCRARV
jgi:glycosyltransferase involved in cell wall biosynthesis